MIIYKKTAGLPRCLFFSGRVREINRSPRASGYTLARNTDVIDPMFFGFLIVTLKAMSTFYVFSSDVKEVASKLGNGTTVQRAMHIVRGTEEALAQFRRDVATGFNKQGTVDPVTGECVLWLDVTKRIPCETYLRRAVLVNKTTGEQFAWYDAASKVHADAATPTATTRAMRLQREHGMSVNDAISWAQRELNNERLYAAMQPAAPVQEQEPEDDDSIDGLESPAPTPKRRGRKKTA